MKHCISYLDWHSLFIMIILFLWHFFKCMNIFIYNLPLNNMPSLYKLGIILSFAAGRVHLVQGDARGTSSVSNVRSAVLGPGAHAAYNPEAGMGYLDNQHMQMGSKYICIVTSMAVPWTCVSIISQSRNSCLIRILNVFIYFIYNHLTCLNYIILHLRIRDFVCVCFTCTCTYFFGPI